jgi:iron complex outermembrane receptor protein
LKQNKIGQFETETPAYNLINFGLGGDVTFKSLKFNTSLSINNVLDTEYINYLSRLKADGILNAARNIVVGLGFKI